MFSGSFGGKTALEMFLEEGYNIKAAGQFRRAYLYGFEYIDVGGDTVRMVQ